MSKFIGVKMVEAVPMTAGQAAYKGYRTPVAEKYSDLEAEGYEITYPDGYKSWCPKDVFDKNSIRIDNLGFELTCNDSYPDYVKRMFTEHSELEAKINKLQDFINSDKYSELSTIQKDLLHKQCNFMIGYMNVLRERIIYEISIPVE